MRVSDSTNYREMLEEMAPDHRRLEQWIYSHSCEGKPTVGDAALALGLTVERIVALADNHFWIDALGQRVDLAALRLVTDGE